VYRIQGNIWSRVEVLSSNPVTWSFCIFLKRNLAYLYPHRFSQITHLSFIYFTEAVLICRNSQAFLPCIYCLIKNRIRGEECHTLRSKTLEIKNLSTLTGILLIRGTMGYHFLPSFLFFFQVDTEVPLILLPDTCPFFSTRLSSTCSFLFPRNIHIFAEPMPLTQ